MLFPTSGIASALGKNALVWIDSSSLELYCKKFRIYECNSRLLGKTKVRISNEK